VSLLDQRPTHPSSLIAYEYARVRRIWRRLAEECSQERRHGSFRNFDVSNTQI
jgi:hypothetical protein